VSVIVVYLMLTTSTLTSVSMFELVIFDSVLLLIFHFASNIPFCF